MKTIAYFWLLLATPRAERLDDLRIKSLLAPGTTRREIARAIA